MSVLLEIKNLTIEYKGISKSDIPTVAVDNVSFGIQKGEIYALAGESGCGKSSTAKAITKLILPKSGDILYNGQSIYRKTRA